MEYLLHASGHYTPVGISAIVFKSLHRVSFSSASLTVSEHRGIVALKNTVNRGFSSIFIDEFLG